MKIVLRKYFLYGRILSKSNFVDKGLYIFECCVKSYCKITGKYLVIYLIT